VSVVDSDTRTSVDAARWHSAELLERIFRSEQTMSVFDKLQCVATGMRRPNDFGRHPVVVAVNERTTGNIRPHTLDANEEHELSVKIAVTFWANRAQIRRQRKVAEATLSHFLYADVLAKVQMIEHAIMDGDATAAMAFCRQIRDVCTAHNTGAGE